MKAEGQKIKTKRVPIPPIEKKCRICKERKLLLNFDINDKAKDKHKNICKSCMASAEEDQTPHTSDYITGKFLMSVYDQLDCLLALTENGVELPDEILEVMSEIVDQDCQNKGIS